MPIDASFYFVAVPAVLLVGLSKGGLGDALGLLGVPILSLAVPPAQAAAILLPILIVMDGASIWMWRKHNDPDLIKIMLPGGLMGVAIGWAAWSIMPAYVMRLIIGLIAIIFSLRFFYNAFVRSKGAETPPQPHNWARAAFWSTLSGYGSFVAHAGGAPFQVYGLPLKLSPANYTGAAVRFFAILNVVKLLPYEALGQLDFTNLAISATLFPIAPIATIVGARIVRKMHIQVFYPLMYAMLTLAGLKLVYDGVSAMLLGGSAH